MNGLLARVKALGSVVVCCIGLVLGARAQAQATTGACCLPSGTCVDTDPCACAQSGGGFQGLGTVCVNTPCGSVAFGACCTQTGCTQTTSASCQTVGGTFSATGTCAALPCNRTPVACCCDNTCTLSDPTFCSHLGGSVPGGATCSPNPCPGACCDAAGNCTYAQPSTCLGTFIGGSCTPSPCLPVVCCDPATGNCSAITSAGACPTGTNPVTGPCSPNTCPPPPPQGVCCDAAGNCTVIVLGTPCTGTILTTATTCTPNNPCPQKVCCDPFTGQCTVLLPCPSGTNPVPGPCTSTLCPVTVLGICCDLQGNCFVMVAGTQCNGTIVTSTGSCNPNPCPQVVCCTGTVCTLVQSVTQCTGTVYPNLSACTSTTCQQSTQVVCCTQTAAGGVICGLIQLGTPCNGQLLPNLSACNPNPCVPSGACCQPCSGACTQTAASACVSPNQYFPGAPCAPGVCPTNPVFGPCCLNGNCITATSCDCVLKGGTWTSGVPCTPAQCIQDRAGACCTGATGVCSVMSAGTCAQIGGTFIAGGSCPNPVCGTASGTCCCCGLCHVLDAAACIIAGGTVSTNTSCTPLTCYTGGGACCDPATGACNIVGGAGQCVAPLVFFPAQPCSTTLCVPTGACCDTCTGTCAVVPQTQCTGTLQVYTAGGSCLPPVICVPTCGACCTISATGAPICTIVPNAAACTGNPSFFGGVGSTCASVNNCQPPTVTCCNVQTGACQTFGGQVCPTGWAGNFSSCNPNPCPLGPCCQQGSTGCTMTTQAGCNGQWLGTAAACNPNPCVRVCCNPANGACSLAAFGTACPTGFLGVAGSTCNPSPCPPRGACCLPGTILCSITFQSQCNGVWLGANTVCTPNPCIKACCNPNTGACFQVFGSQPCPTSATPVLTGVACTPNPCPPVGPCCNFPGGCTITTQSACGGTWGPPNTSCNTACVHVCCTPSGGCQVISIFLGCSPGFTTAGTTCNPSPCPPVGACCVFPHGCTIVTQGSCNGWWVGPNTACSPSNPCLHVCCNSCTGACSVASIYAICAPGFTYSPATSCSPSNPCPQALGPCCLPNGSCVTISLVSCQSQHGVYFGCQGVSCGPTFCRGACCVGPFISAYGAVTGTTCIITSQAQCNGNWHGYGSVCASPANSTNLTTCCPANVNHVNGVNLQDLFDFITAWFNGCLGQPGAPCNGVNADFDGNGIFTINDIFAFLNAWFTGCH